MRAHASRAASISVSACMHLSTLFCARASFRILHYVIHHDCLHGPQMVPLFTPLCPCLGECAYARVHFSLRLSCLRVHTEWHSCYVYVLLVAGWWVVRRSRRIPTHVNVSPPQSTFPPTPYANRYMLSLHISAHLVVFYNCCDAFFCTA